MSSFGVSIPSMSRHRHDNGVSGRMHAAWFADLFFSGKNHGNITPPVSQKLWISWVLHPRFYTQNTYVNTCQISFKIQSTSRAIWSCTKFSISKPVSGFFTTPAFSNMLRG